MFNWLKAGADLVTYAYGQAGYEDIPEGEWGPEGFTQRWGGLDAEHFARALQEGQGEDRLLAIFALGYHHTRWVAELVLPLLQSPEPQERWASALSLGLMHEERAFPVLLTLLTECLPPPDRPSDKGENRWLYNQWRGQMILVIAEYNKLEAIPQLLYALQTFQNIEQAIPDRPGLRRYWSMCQGKVVYVLGWFDRFEILNVGAVTPLVPWGWYVFLALGHLHAHLHSPYFFASGFIDYPTLQEHVMTMLKEQFDLSEEEQERCLKAFSDTMW